ncbi:MAG: hypothetical protein AAGG06_15125 [Pseudomonadota bacterium]
MVGRARSQHRPANATDRDPGSGLSTFSIEEEISDLGAAMSRLSEGDLSVQMEVAVDGAGVSMQNDINAAVETLSDIICSVADATAAAREKESTASSRAGEAVKGFAVVALEGRGLAQRSSEAASETPSTIGPSNSKVIDGLRLVNDAENALYIIDEAAGSIQSIRDERAFQTVNVADVDPNVSDLKTIAKQNAAIADQSAQKAAQAEQRVDALDRLIAAFDAAASCGPGRRGDAKGCSLR